MKKYLLWLFGITMMLTACNQNNPEQTAKVDDYSYLIESLMRFDDNGEITGYMIGDNLNEADPLDISVPVANYDEAIRVFRSLLPMDVTLKQEGTSLIWAMTDSLGNEEGELILEEGSTEDSIAVMRFKGHPKIESAPERRVTTSKFPPIIPSYIKCTFIPESAWPENAGAAEEILNEQYYLGAVVKKEKDEGFGSGWFVVIAPWTPQECGLMVKIEKDSYYYNNIPKKKCSGAGTLHRVYRELHKGSNYHDIFEVIGQQEEVNWPTTLNGSYLSKTQKGAAYILVNLETNSEKYFNPDAGRYIENAPARMPAASEKMRMIYCYCFRPNGDKIKFW
ncbi:MAG: hypothetical protein SPK90_07205 [Bacteroidales bacterium]|nr:hypothetical protein [Bacteroidales bacterium]MDY6406408.1 hypothetical protein [Bacteroidales bacterium]